MMAKEQGDQLQARCEQAARVNAERESRLSAGEDFDAVYGEATTPLSKLHKAHVTMERQAVQLAAKKAESENLARIVKQKQQKVALLKATIRQGPLTREQASADYARLTTARAKEAFRLKFGKLLGLQKIG